MSQVDIYLDAAERANTRRSYASAIQHFEVEWEGLLPATIDSIARYLAVYAESLSLNTLKHRLAALSRWHQDHGFPDPTKALKIRQVLKGIRTLHPAQEKRAKPLELEILRGVADWLTSATAAAVSRGDSANALRHTRDRALVLLGFWRGFRSDELANLRIEFMEIKPGEGLTCFLPRSKGDRNLEGRSYSCPALSRLCPVEAVEDWLALSKLTAGPLFRKIDRWGHLSEAELTPSSIIPVLRKLLSQAGVADADSFSSHSLRRGFAQWAGMSGWDIRELMSYVGWRDVKAAMRYLDGVSPDQKARFEQGWIGCCRKQWAFRRRSCRACLRSPSQRLRLPLICRPSTVVDVVSPMPCGIWQVPALPDFRRNRWIRMAVDTGFPSRRLLSTPWTTTYTPCSTNSIELPMPVSASWRQYAAIR